MSMPIARLPRRVASVLLVAVVMPLVGCGSREPLDFIPSKERAEIIGNQPRRDRASPPRADVAAMLERARAAGAADTRSSPPASSDRTPDPDPFVSADGGRSVKLTFAPGQDALSSAHRAQLQALGRLADGSECHVALRVGPGGDARDPSAVALSLRRAGTVQAALDGMRCRVEAHYAPTLAAGVIEASMRRQRG